MTAVTLAGLTLRKAVAPEAEALSTLAYGVWERDLLPFLRDSAELRRGEQRRLHHAVRDQLDRIIVAELDGTPVGWVSRAWRRAYIPFLFVAGAKQGRGVGSLLLRRVESLLELGGADRIQLDTLADNVRAVHFYQNQGYRILAYRPDTMPGRDELQSVRLEKLLTPYRGPIQDSE